MYTKRGIVETDNLSDPHSGDFVQGKGISSAQLQIPNSPVTESEANERKHASASGGSLLTQSPGIWLFLIALVIALKLAIEGAGKAEEFRTVRIGLENFFIVGTLAAIYFFALRGSAALVTSKSWIAVAFKQFAGMI